MTESHFAVTNTQTFFYNDSIGLIFFCPNRIEPLDVYALFTLCLKLKGEDI